MTQIFYQQCLTAVAQTGCSPGATDQGELSEADTLIGLFQAFRPDGAGVESLLESLPCGAALTDRLLPVFDAAGNDRRPRGGRDAYFVVRNPPALTVELAEHHATQWLDGLRRLAEVVGDAPTVEVLSRSIRVRVLEGLPPKNPKNPADRTELLTTLLDRCPKLTAQILGVDEHAALLRPAYYFLACDAMLRDVLMWPFYASATGLSDPLRDYFALWSHGVKYRSYAKDQLDLYLPRETSE
ncbi:MAG: apolipoprotein acyltransferase [Planctomycetota bacterium]